MIYFVLSATILQLKCIEYDFLLHQLFYKEMFSHYYKFGEVYSNSFDYIQRTVVSLNPQTTKTLKTILNKNMSKLSMCITLLQKSLKNIALWNIIMIHDSLKSCIVLPLLRG